MTKNTIGQFIAALRKANGMTQQEVADRLGISQSYISRLEKKIILISMFMVVDTAYLVKIQRQVI